MRILIVGGGVAGLSLAIALKQRGIAAEIVEKQIGDSHAGTGLYLPGNATRAVGQLGLLDSVLANAVPIGHQRILDHHGRLLCNTRTSDVWASCAPCLALPHATIHTLLRDAVRHTEIRYGASITAIGQSAGKCEVSFADGTTQVYDLVVGADGINSAVRKIVAPTVAPEYSGQVCWRFITQNTGVRCWTAMLGNGCTLLAIPVSREQAYVYADIMLAPGTNPESIRHEGFAQFRGFSAPLFPLLEQAPKCEHSHFGRIGQVVMDKWVHGRVVLMGDAAHASSPSMAEGAGMAIEDALVLAQTLTTETHVETALSVYEQRRQPRVRWVQQQCAARDKMRALPSWARSGVLRLLGNKLYRRSYEPLLAEI